MTNPDDSDHSNRLLTPFRFTKKRLIIETLELCYYESYSPQFLEAVVSKNPMLCVVC